LGETTLRREGPATIVKPELIRQGAWPSDEQDGARRGRCLSGKRWGGVGRQTDIHDKSGCQLKGVPLSDDPKKMGMG